MRRVIDVDTDVNNLSYHDLTPPSYLLPPGLKRLLGLNLKFIPTPSITKKRSNIAWKDSLHQLARQLKLRIQFQDIDKTSYNRTLYVPNPSYVPTAKLPPDIERWFFTAMGSSPLVSSRRRYNLSRSLRKLLSSLTASSHLKIVATDKNLGPAVLLRSQYIQLGLIHLSTTPDSYVSVQNVDLDAIRIQIRRFHRRLLLDFPKDLKESKIIVHDLHSSRCSLFHILPKLHKRDSHGKWTGAVRPIVSSICSPTYGLSKWLDFYLRPYLRKTSTFLRDSPSLIKMLRSTPINADTLFLTLDAQSLYTSIPPFAAMQVISTMTKDHPKHAYFVQALDLIFRNNYFAFGHSYWKQTKGLAMGTPCAPTVASLYLAFYEEKFIVSSRLWRTNIRLFRRYIDDLLVVWQPSDDCSIQELLSLLALQPGITWIPEPPSFTTTFLDLTLLNQNGSLVTRTYQKPLNLYLYTPFSSSHPPHTLTGLIKGTLLKYKMQNTLPSDFLAIANLFFRRLVARGYYPSTLKTIFDPLLTRDRSGKFSSLVSNAQSKSTRLPNFYFKTQFDPNGVSSAQIHTLLNLPLLQDLLSRHGYGRVLICFEKSSNLGNLLCRTRITTTPEDFGCDSLSH